ncbi:hypothetical protein CS542_02350 [Pedobacter sp. IW39]|nr:hypothetical protein CS542_02350 [Pedobacter sp. IW39]
MIRFINNILFGKPAQQNKSHQSRRFGRYLICVELPKDYIQKQEREETGFPGQKSGSVLQSIIERCAYCFTG